MYRIYLCIVHTPIFKRFFRKELLINLKELTPLKKKFKKRYFVITVKLQILRNELKMILYDFSYCNYVFNFFLDCLTEVSLK